MISKIPYLGSLDTRSRRNLITGFSYQLISIGMGLLLPYLFITNLGSESNGLLNSVGQIFVCLGLLEAGVGTATIQALYRPIANCDSDGINGILSATHRYYLKTGVWYTVAVVILTAVYPFFVDSALPSSTIRYVIFLQGVGTIISYLFQAKYTFLLRAEGKNYIVTLLSLFVLLLRNFGKIVVIQLGYDVVAVQVIHLITIIIEAFFILYYVKRKYPWINVQSKPNYQAIAQKTSVLAQSIAWMVFNHTDVLVLTICTRDLGLISVYSVYSLVFEAAQNLLNQTRESFQFKIGNVAQKSEKELDSYFRSYGTKILFFTLLVFTVIYLMSTPFVILYTHGITDAQYDIVGVSELFFIYKLLYGIRALYKQVIEANGHFKQTQTIAIAEAVINLFISIVLVYWLGIIGVLIGTVISLLYSVVSYVLYIYRYVAQNAVRSHLNYLMRCFPIIIAVVYIGYKKIIRIESWTSMILYIFIFSIISYVIYQSIYKINKLHDKIRMEK